MAKDPEIAGLGFAAVRDLNSWLKYGTAAEGNPTRWPTTSQRIYTEISSQPGRLLNDFRHLGFNEDESGRKVLDGHMQWISAGSGINMNYRFSQSGRTERNRQDHLYPENLFPFANVSTTDPHHRARPTAVTRSARRPTRARSASRSTRPTSIGSRRRRCCTRRRTARRIFRIRRTPATTSCPACSTAPATAPTGGTASSSRIR